MVVKRHWPKFAKMANIKANCGPKALHSRKILILTYFIFNSWLLKISIFFAIYSLISGFLMLFKFEAQCETRSPVSPDKDSNVSYYIRYK
jgi:hypothetical protein